MKTCRSVDGIAHLLSSIHVVFPEIQRLVLAEFNTLVTDLYHTCEQSCEKYNDNR